MPANETRIRRDFLDPLFGLPGWNVVIRIIERKQPMNDIPVFDPDTLAETPVEGLIDLLIEHGDRVPRGLFDVSFRARRGHGGSAARWRMPWWPRGWRPAPRRWTPLRCDIRFE